MNQDLIIFLSANITTSDTVSPTNLNLLSLSEQKKIQYNGDVCYPKVYFQTQEYF